jgi:hypothetical protein
MRYRELKEVTVPECTRVKSSNVLNFPYQLALEKLEALERGVVDGGQCRQRPIVVSWTIVSITSLRGRREPTA